MEENFYDKKKMQIVVEINGNQLDVNFKKIVTFSHKIKSVIILDSQIIVLLEIPKGIYESDNIYCVDMSGSFIWQIQNRSFLSEKYAKEQIKGPYVGIHMHKDGVLEAVDYLGGRYLFNVENGYVIERNTKGRDW